MLYKKFFEDKNIKYKEEEVSRLENLDTLCNKCKLEDKDTLLCEGFRVYLDDGASEQYGILNTYGAFCSKKQYQLRQAKIMKRIAVSGVPESVSKALVADRTQLPYIELDSSDPIMVIDKMFTPIQCLIPTDDSTIEASWKLVTALNLLNISAKWLWPKTMYQKDYRIDPEFWKGLVNKLTFQTEFLVVHRADMHIGADFKKEILMQALEFRLVHRFPTFFSVGDDPIPDNETEKFVYDTIKNLPKGWR